MPFRDSSPLGASSVPAPVRNRGWGTSGLFKAEISRIRQFGIQRWPVMNPESKVALRPHPPFAASNKGVNKHEEI
jgi:hypothetical protein